MRRFFTAIITGVFLLVGLGSCGQMGPLYLPDSEPVSDPEAQSETIPATAPVPEQVKSAQAVPAQ